MLYNVSFWTELQEFSVLVAQVAQITRLPLSLSYLKNYNQYALLISTTG